MSAGRIYTLELRDRGARLLDPAGGSLGEGEGVDLLEGALPAGARVQVLLRGSRLQVHGAEVPGLKPREARDVARRLAREAGLGGEPAHVLEPDPQAEGGHALWLAAFPRPELDRWLGALAEAGARPVSVMPWQRALLAGAPLPDPVSTLYLTLEPGEARLLCFRGRRLLFARALPLPGELDLQEPDAAALADLSRLVTEELNLLLPFLRQKHRGAPPGALAVVGLPAAAALAVGQGMMLPVHPLAPALTPFLLAGAERERRHGLDLLPVEVREARRRGVALLVVRACAAAMFLLGAGTRMVLVRQERALAAEALQAEGAAQRRLLLEREGEAAARLRFGLLRLRRAEERQKKAVEQLEQLGVRLFQVPGGVDLRRVEITQVPGTDLRQRFTVEGGASTGRMFSLGALAAYYRHLETQPGLQLEPLKDVAVADGAKAAQARFQLGGTLR